MLRLVAKVFNFMGIALSYVSQDTNNLILCCAGLVIACMGEE